ncbi:adenosylhomocysteinase [Fodinicola feengrottensis]|uniref:Adenosylhomocysteinase n=1 Tax=Fodinicola feengrottensis TaxID=435914 RepID=A0ABP4SAQ9_9ACTN
MSRQRARSDIADPALADQGAARIGRSERSMPVLRAIRAGFAEKRPLTGLTIAACLHVTAETAILVRTLTAGGAQVRLAASNPLSTQDDVAAALAGQPEVTVFARRGVPPTEYHQHVDAAIGAGPALVIDNGCDLSVALHTDHKELAAGVIAGCEDTPTGVLRLRAMAAERALGYPVVALDDTPTRRLADHRHGTGQSCVDAILRSTNILLAGRTVVVAGFGPVGRGVAERVRGMGAMVVVTEVDPVPALDAVLSGYRVLPMTEAAPLADVVVTATGNRDVVRGEHLAALRSGAVLANAGHFDVEIDVRWLREHAVDVRSPRPAVQEFTLPGGATVSLLAEGRIANLGAADGNPPAVMDLAFAEQALTVGWLASRDRLPVGVHRVPSDVGTEIATLELDGLGVRIDDLNADQRRYLSAWQGSWEA